MYNKAKKKQGKGIVIDKKVKFILLATMVFAMIAGVWLIMTPARERQDYLDAQEALPEDILQGYEVEYADEQYSENQHNINGADSTYSADSADVSNSNETTGHEQAAPFEPFGNGFRLNDLPENVPQQATEAFTPLPDNEFPTAVTGIGILTIESIDLRLPVAEGVTEETLRIAVGRVPQTAQIGDIGNAVIAGHRNYTHGQMFNRLGELEIGDIVCYQARNGEFMRFMVFEIAEIIPDDQIAFVQPHSESIITLYTCTPIRTATHRLIIRAQRVELGIENEELRIENQEGE